IAASTVLLGASFWFPVPSILTWLCLFIAGASVALLEWVWLVLRRLTGRLRLAAIVGFVALAGFAWFSIAPRLMTPKTPTWGTQWQQPKACALIGYSTVEDQGLRGDRGG